MVSYINIDLNANEDIILFVSSKFYWRIHFGNEIPINLLFAEWKCMHVLDFRPWKWVALDMGFVDKRPSRMQGIFLV